MKDEDKGSKINPRWKSGRRRKYQQRFRAMQAPCGICNGRLGPIHYDEPSDSKHPLSFCIDEIIPISKWQEAGFNSPQEAADTFSNLRAAHWICNAKRGNKIHFTMQTAQPQPKQKIIRLDGKW